MKPNAPRLDKRSFQDLLKQMRSMVPFYTPEWNPVAEKEHGQALMKIYLHMLEQVIFRLNQVPEKNFIAFLDMLGIKLRPAQSAKAAVTFKLAEGTREHVTVPKGTLLTGEGTDGEEVTFETESDLRLTPSLLKEIVSVDATKDKIFIHTDAYLNNERFHILTGENKQERSLYIGHADLFSLTNPTEISIYFTLKKGATGGVLKLVWEYWDGERWVELVNFDVAGGVSNPDDTTALLSKSGRMVVKKTNVGEIATFELFQVESRWLRCRLKNTLTAGNTTLLPEIDTIELSTKPIVSFPAELAFNNDIPIDLEKPITPFGELPGLFDTFYIASDEAFSKKGAKITLDITAKLENSGSISDVSAILSWEYWNGKSWRVLQVTDNTDRFSKSEKITFTCPQDIEKIKVNGEEKYWIRVRIIDGDYGKEIIIKEEQEELRPEEKREFELRIVLIGFFIRNPGWIIQYLENVLQDLFSSITVLTSKGEIFFPIITNLKICYEEIPVLPQHCFSLNNLEVADHITELVDLKQSFIPFKKLPEQFQGLFLGFDKQIVGGPVRILFNLSEQILTEADTLKIQWFYWKGDHWSKINVQDGTEHLTRKDLLEFSLPLGFKSQNLFGKSQFWIKGNVTEGIFKTLDSVEDGPKVPELIGIFPNSTYAIQASVVNDEILGTSDLTANQAFQLLNPLIISQTIFINEPTNLSEDEENLIIQEEGEDAIASIIDQKGEILNYRVRWHAVEDFYQSGPQSRHYIVDKRQGIIQFGDGINGLVPPQGRDNIRVSYRYGGGINGNVQIGKISALKNAIPFVNEVTNHLPADGGSDTETLEEVLLRGPSRLKNRDRAVTSDDYAAMARNASRKIKRAKCLPNINADGEFSPGHVSVIIVPDTQKADEPVSRLLVKVVQEYLEAYSTNMVSVPRHIDVRGAIYIQIIIEVSVVPVSIEASARVESGISEALSDYLHPLTGGKRGYGWEFGKNICCAEIIALLEGVTDVDYVQELDILADGERQPGDIIMGDDTLPFSGEHRVNLIFDSNDDDKSLSNLPFSTCQDQSNEFCREGLK